VKAGVRSNDIDAKPASANRCNDGMCLSFTLFNPDANASTLVIPIA